MDVFLENFSYFLENYSTPILIIFLLLHIFLAILTFHLYINFSNIFALKYACSSSFLGIFYIRYKQILALLCITKHKLQHNLERFQVSKVLSIHRQIITSLVFFCQINRMYGRLFFSSLVVFCPINAIFTTWILHGLVAADKFFVVIFFILYGLNFCFLLHLLLAYFTKLIHQPALILLALSLANTQRKHTRNKTLSRFTLKLSLAFQALHTTNPYGFTYSSFGLISLMAFAKYLQLYSKFLMFTFKLFKTH